MGVKCGSCGAAIPAARLRALPGATTCVRCSDAEPRRGLMDYGHKTGGVVVILPNDPEQRRLAERAYRRAR